MYLYSKHPLNEVQEVINFYVQSGYDYKTIQQLDYIMLYNEYKKYKEEKNESKNNN